MLIVIGAVVVREGCIDQALQLSQQHVDRSRCETGCIEHGVHIDGENPQRLVFLEKWEDQASLSRHFAEPGSIAFVKAIGDLAIGKPDLDIYEAVAAG